MRWLPIVGLMTGCGVIDALLPTPACEDRLVMVDEVSGAVRFEVDTSDCEPEDNAFPNGVEYLLLQDRDWEPIFAKGANVCNRASYTALTVKDLGGKQLRFDPSDPELGGRVREDNPEMFIEGAWMSAAYWEGNSSRATWQAYFRLGEPGSVVYADECFADD